jgi:hypothetical protein
MTGPGWVVSGWGPGMQTFWSAAEKAWVSRDRATVYATKAEAEAALASAPPAQWVQMRTVIASDAGPGPGGGRRSVWPRW